MRQVPARRRLFAATVAASLVLLSPPDARAQAPVIAPAPAELALSGRVAQPRTISLANLQAMPAVTVEVAHTGPQGVQPSRFKGVLLWPLVQAAAPVDENGPRTHLWHTLLALGRDGYGVALAIGELDPNFEGKKVLVAYAQDGKSLPGLRLVVPDDARAGRSVRDLVAIEVH